jgi:hypothetical protein
MKIILAISNFLDRKHLDPHYPVVYWSYYNYYYSYIIPLNSFLFFICFDYFNRYVFA